MPDIITRNAKMVVAVLVIGVAAIGSSLGVDTGINVEEWWQVIGVTLLGGIGVWATPNKDNKKDGDDKDK